MDGRAFILRKTDSLRAQNAALALHPLSPALFGRSGHRVSVAGVSITRAVSFTYKG